MQLLRMLAVGAIALPAFGQPADAATIRTSKVAGWSLLAESELNSQRFGSCKLTSAVRGATISFVVTRDLQWNAQVASNAWKFAPDRNFEIYFALDPQSDGPMFRYRAAVAGERAFNVSISEKIAADHELFAALRKGRTLTIVVDDQVNPNLELPLTGTSHALPALLRCVSQHAKSAAPSGPPPRSPSPPRQAVHDAPASPGQ